jgi:hypothetical protein
MKMNRYEVEFSALIEAPAAQIYAIISDYHDGHPAILPARYFSDMKVTAGGRGAGTQITVTMNVFGVKSLYQMTVSEPEPGRILQEEDPVAGVVTTFTVDPTEAGARVTITTSARAANGLRGQLEKLMNPAIMRRIYREELDQLARVVRAELIDPGPTPDGQGSAVT